MIFSIFDKADFYRFLEILSRNKIVVEMQKSSLWLQFLYYMMKALMFTSLCQNAKIITLVAVSLLPDEIVIFTITLAYV